ncbi:hypothetical protein ACOBQJ_14260 [Pelotomaculum propionicicum]|uniref:hypothetical protein n=1 Tax=Pelotomaculum propionicicum TaxID=258475 RepID=UPI003B7DE250
MTEDKCSKKKSWSIPQLNEIKLKMTESGGCGYGGGGGCSFGDGSGGGAGFAGGGSIVGGSGFATVSGLLSVS